MAFGGNRMTRRKIEPHCGGRMMSTGSTLSGNTHAGETTQRPASIDAMIAIVQREFPHAAIRITGRARTIRRQAELMAQRRRASRTQFLHTYRPARHITEMDLWVARHPQASELQTVNE